jgi:hypothetical protein
METSKFNPDDCIFCSHNGYLSQCQLPQSVITFLSEIHTSAESLYDIVYDAHRTITLTHAPDPGLTLATTPTDPTSDSIKMKNHLPTGTLNSQFDRSNPPSRHSSNCPSRLTVESSGLPLLHRNPLTLPHRVHPLSDSSDSRSGSPPPYTYPEQDSPRPIDRSETSSNSLNFLLLRRPPPTFNNNLTFENSEHFKVYLPSVASPFRRTHLEISTHVQAYCQDHYDYSTLSDNSPMFRYALHVLNDITTVICELEALTLFKPRRHDHFISRMHLHRLEKSLNHHDLYVSTPLSFVSMRITPLSSSTDYTNHVVSHNNYQDFSTLAPTSLKHLCFLEYFKNTPQSDITFGAPPEMFLVRYIELTLTILFRKFENPSLLLESLLASLKTRHCPHLSPSLSNQASN